MTRKKYVFRKLSRYICTRRFQFLLENIHVVSFSDHNDVICCFVGRGKDIYLLCNYFIFLFSAFTERLGGCLYKCGCVVKFSILMSTIRKNSFSSRYRHAFRRLPSYTIVYSKSEVLPHQY